MYCLHQSEEHAYDIRGWRYSFVPSLNLEIIGPILFEKICNDRGSSSLVCPMDPKMALYVNVVAVWIGFGGCSLAATIYPQRFIFAGALNWGMAVVNGLMGHIVTSIITKSYNPGVLQSLLMVPLGVYVITKSGRPWLCILNGILAHVALIAGVNMVLRLGTNEAFTMTILMLAASLLLPLVISNHVTSYNTLHKSK